MSIADLVITIVVSAFVSAALAAFARDTRVLDDEREMLTNIVIRVVFWLLLGSALAIFVVSMVRWLFILGVIPIR